MRLFQAALDTCLDSLFFASLSVHGLHFTVYAPSSSDLKSHDSNRNPKFRSICCDVFTIFSRVQVFSNRAIRFARFSSLADPDSNLSGMFRRSASLAIPHLKSFAAIPSVSLVQLGHTNRNVFLSHESQREIALVKALSRPIPYDQQGEAGEEKRACVSQGMCF